MEAKKKVPLLNKIAYGVGTGGGCVFNQIAAAFLLQYYTDTALISAGAIATMFLVCRVFDGISDLLMGAVVDKTNTKWGKARPWLILSGPLTLLGIEDHKQDFNHDTQRLLRVEKNLKECNGLLKHLGLYHKYRPLYEQYLKTHKSPKFREKNIRELLLYDGAVKYLREYQQAHHVNSVPNYQSLKEAKVRLTAQQQELYERRRRLKDTIKTMEDGYKLLEQLEPKRSQPNLHRYHQLE